MTGVWHGTIGKSAIQACYNGGENATDGKYFYLQRLSTIPLIADEKSPGELTEGWADTKGVARWRIEAITGNRMTGVWTGNGRTLPINLTRIPFATSADESACSSLVFVQPIIAATRIAKAPGRVLGLAVEKWKMVYADDSVSVESFQLPGRTPAIAAINRRLREPFDKADDGWKWCLRNAGTWGGGYSDSISARLVTAHWLSVTSSNESDCGGAHPNNSSEPILFDRQSGGEVDLYSWFESAFSTREKVEGYADTIDRPRGPLLALILGLHPRVASKDEECGDAVDTASSWSLELKPDGIAFTPDLPRVVMACGDEIVLPFAKLKPFLNATGRRGVATLIADRR